MSAINVAISNIVCEIMSKKRPLKLNEALVKIQEQFYITNNPK